MKGCQVFFLFCNTLVTTFTMENFKQVQTYKRILCVSIMHLQQLSLIDKLISFCPYPLSPTGLFGSKFQV